MKLLYRFDDAPLPTAGEVGGKGLSLITLYQAGLPVPNGFVLTVSFFEPWLVLLKATPAWKTFLAADDAGLREACQRLKQISSGYELNSEQKKRLREALFAFEEKTLFWLLLLSCPNRICRRPGRSRMWHFRHDNLRELECGEGIGKAVEKGENQGRKVEVK